jgi:hypothetical protein
VSFVFFFSEVTARAGNWAGRDKVLNFLSRPPSAILALFQPRMRSEFAKCRIRIFTLDAREICKKMKKILTDAVAIVRVWGLKQDFDARLECRLS